MWIDPTLAPPGERIYNNLTGFKGPTSKGREGRSISSVQFVDNPTPWYKTNFPRGVRTYVRRSVGLSSALLKTAAMPFDIIGRTGVSVQWRKSSWGIYGFPNYFEQTCYTVKEILSSYVLVLFKRDDNWSINWVLTIMSVCFNSDVFNPLKCSCIILNSSVPSRSNLHF